MSWSLERFNREVKKFDRLLRARLARNGRDVLVERKCARESKCIPVPKEFHNHFRHDDYICWSQGYSRVMKIRRDLLNHWAFLALRHSDIQAHGGADKYADLMDEEDRLKAERLEHSQSEYLQCRGEEIYDKHMIMQGDIVSGFKSKVEGGMEFPNVSDKRRFAHLL